MAIEVFSPGAGHADQNAVVLLATGRGSLAFLLGDEPARFRLFSGRINWDRVLLARIDGQVVGFLAFQWAGRGPYAPKFADFSREFGLFPGLWRCWLNHALEWRNRRRGFYIYGLKVLPEMRRQGVASALLEAAERYAAGLKVGSAELEVYDTNERALAFYLSQGYQVEGAWRLGGVGRLLGFSAVLRLAKPLSGN